MKIIIVLFAMMAGFIPPSYAVSNDVDLILYNGKITTQNKTQPEAQAVAIKDGLIHSVGSNTEILKLKTEKTQIVDLNDRRVIPGLNDSHTHVVRGGRFYNTELRWDGVKTIDRAISMVGEQAKRTPQDQWVRVIGSWSPFQFEEKRMPTPAELTKAAPDTPVFVLFLYSQGFLNKAAVDKLGITKDTKAPKGGRYEITEDGGAILYAEPDPTILYQTIGKLPSLSEAEQVNSTKHFYRELNRFGLTSVIDAGGGGHVFPVDYIGTEILAENGEMPLRVSSFLFPQNKGKEIGEFKNWVENWEINKNMAEKLAHGFVVEGAGEFLVWSAGDFENFMAKQPKLEEREGWRAELIEATTYLVQNKWPIRIHATYDETITHILDVFEEVHQSELKAGRNGFNDIRWAIDHAETVKPKNIARIKKLNGGIAIQARMAYAGEYFKERYGAEAAQNAPPLRQIIDAEIPMGTGTDATRVASHNPWNAIYWLVTGKSVGGEELLSKSNQLSLDEALYHYTIGSAWFSGEENEKGRIKVGQFADIAVLSDDIFSISKNDIPKIESVLTVTGGNIVYAADEFKSYSPSLPKVMPTWSPVKYFGGYQK